MNSGYIVTGLFGHITELYANYRADGNDQWLCQREIGRARVHTLCLMAYSLEYVDSHAYYMEII